MTKDELQNTRHGQTTKKQTLNSKVQKIKSKQTTSYKLRNTK